MSSVKPDVVIQKLEILPPELFLNSIKCGVNNGLQRTGTYYCRG